MSPFSAVLRNALALALLAPGGAVLAADPAPGRALAEQYCARCHTIGPDGAFKEFPPSFPAIAVYRTDQQIRDRIMAPPYHSGMPRFIEWTFDRGDIDDVVAYIRSLEGAIE